ncbi:MAG: hypothetical protein ABSE25_09510 [Syntrophorhabdales bacterium]|jgi:hypothetical protein
MDLLSAVLLGALNVPVFLFFCRLFQKAFFRKHRDFWRSLLAWSFDPHGFFDRESRHNHLAVLFLSLSAACCVFLVLVEYELAYRFVDSLRSYQPFQALTKL